MFEFKETQHGVLDATRKVGKRTLTLRVRNLRLDRDGYPRGVVAMIVDTTAVHSTRLETDDADERHRFVNALYGTRRELRDGGMSRSGTSPKLGSEIIKEFPPEDCEHEFMLWSRALWNAYIGPTSGKDVEGDDEPSAPPWAVPGLVMAGATCIWAGDAGANKSTLMRLTCQSLTHGVYDVIPIRDQERSIWVNAEEPDVEHTRQLGNVNAALGLPRRTPMFTIQARGMRIDDLAYRLEKAVRETGAQHVFIDSLSRLSRGMSLNDNDTATMLVDSVSGLGTSVNWIGHTGWENRTRLAGSRHFENAARVMVLVQSRVSIGGVSPELTRGVRTTVTKANGAIVTDSMYWTLGYHRQHGLLSARMAPETEWPALRCAAVVGETFCNRRTWDGVYSIGIRCARHRGEADEE